MQINLSPEHEEWLRSQLAEGRFSSLDEAVAIAIEQLKADSFDDDDLDWAKPLIDEGLSELDRGEALPANEVFARIEARLREKP